MTTTTETRLPTRPDGVTDAKLFIDGEWVEAVSGERTPVIDPSRESQISSIALAGPEDVARAVAAARREVDEGAWSRVSGADRGRMLWRLADLIEEHREELAALESVDIGRPIGEPFFGEIPLASEVFRYFAGYADKIHGTTFDLPDLGGKSRRTYTLRQPLGVVGAITPWNAPTMITAWKLAPALAAGNTIVLKSAQEASLSTVRLVQLIEEAGFPAGTVNLVTGRGSVAGEALVTAPGVDKISFTGSPEVGRGIAAKASGALKKIVLELGGKSPQIIRADADLDEIISTVGTGVFANQGQTCASGSRIFVQRDVLDALVDRLAAHADSIRVGDPFDEATQMGTLINERQLKSVSALVEQGREYGVDVVTGGERLGDRGYFFKPTVLVSDNDSPVARQEIFGPVGTVIPFDTDEEALRLANDTEYGLTSVLWTNDSSAINRFTKGLKAGSVWVNAWGPPHPATPWLGVKTSGIGEELGTSGLLAETVEKVVNVVG
ncbi:aldehyde dehydrogenase family protein [Gulosibacter molinativorax]|uniref:Betaine-aldehyde dehydrogenase n=1 Tax=Gulosibacter molinativorax TaxID=256821 RepID=A0ABT7CDG7_9MICO|nr:aldehyde dehydrogenase family protein [Gulosibacter molinativorax]MDJ1372704.1 betaine-aldehyde dehydrogenase [Gulosibacter molinativorax]QUY63183.1 Phenylacetaldehyde dehydrogenase [Gulosibacter molinativorax]